MPLHCPTGALENAAMRIMTVAHGHPALARGGAEVAAYSMFSHLKGTGHESVFVARADANMIGHNAEFGAFRSQRDEILVNLPTSDSFSLLSSDHDRLSRIVAALANTLQPNIVHVHHYAFWGIDILRLFKRCGAKVVLTLHEYLLICHRFGQMVKINGRLCSHSSPTECSQCFPEFAASHFFLREQIIKTYCTKYVDHFIAPSKFLADRYVAWGLAAERVSVIENPLPPFAISSAERLCNGAAPKGEAGSIKPLHGSERGEHPPRVRIGFFGQLNPFKGVDVLLRALLLMGPVRRSDLFVGVHGSGLEFQEAAFCASINAYAAELTDCVGMFGPYDNERVLDLMNAYDWIIVPSIWWENSPVVIQEALALNKRLLCSRIGGISEKAADGAVVFFDPGNPADLAEKLRNLPDLSALQCDKLARAPAERHVEHVEEIVRIYGSVLEGR